MSVHCTSIPQAQAQYSSHRGHIFLIADGMGGHQAGEVASSLSVVTIEGFLLNTLKRFFNLQASEELNVMKEVQSALLQADARIFDEAASHPELFGMGTTVTMAFAVNWKLFVAHAGDSRCYLISRNNLHQITQDHTVVAEMVLRTRRPRECGGLTGAVPPQCRGREGVVLRRACVERLTCSHRAFSTADQRPVAQSIQVVPT